VGRHYYPLDFLHTATSDAYADKVMGYGPIAYWPLWELSGTTARCLVNPAQNGTYNSDVSTWPPGAGIGDGNTAPFFDGANDFVNVLTATFTGNFDGTEGSIQIWAKVANVGVWTEVWTDATTRETYRFLVDGNNLSIIRREAANNQLGWFHFAGGPLGPIVENGVAETGWMHLVGTWSETVNQQIAYRDTVNKGILVAGAWAGVLAQCTIGSEDPGPNGVWNGWLAHCAVWNRALSAPEIAALSVV